MKWSTLNVSATVTFFLNIFVICQCNAQSNELENNEHKAHESIKSTAIFCILIIILLLTLAFELINEFVFETLEHKKMGYLKEVANTLFKEITILGFISLFIFSLTRCGFIMKLNDKYIGQNRVEITAIKELTAEKENPYAAPTTLFELFEKVHIFVFFLMITFAIIVGIFLCLAAAQSYRWQKYEDTTVQNFQNLVELGIVKSDHLDYWLASSKLVDYGQPFSVAPHGRINTASYLSSYLTKFLTELVEIPPSSWICLIPISFLLRPAMDFPAPYVVAFSYVSSIGLFLFMTAVYKEMELIKKYFYPSRSKTMKYILETKDYKHTQPIPEGRIDKISLIQQNQSILTWIPGGRLYINKYEAAFGFTVKGPSFFRKLMQLLIFLHTLGIAIFVKMIISKYGRHLLFEPFGVILGTVPLVFIILSLSLFPKIAINFVFVTSIGCFVDKEIFEKQREKHINDKVKRQKQLIEFIRTKALTEFSNRDTQQYHNQLSEAMEEYKLLYDQHRRLWQEIFVVFSRLKKYDSKEEPKSTSQSIEDFSHIIITKDQMECIFEVFDVRKFVRDLDTRFQELWTFAICNEEGLQFKEFIFVMMILFREHLSKSKEEKHDKDKTMLNYMWHKIDEDGDGIILKEEFFSLFNNIKPSMDALEIEEIFNSLAGDSLSDQLHIEKIILWMDDIEKKYNYCVAMVGGYSNDSHEIFSI